MSACRPTSCPSAAAAPAAIASANACVQGGEQDTVLGKVGGAPPSMLAAQPLGQAPTKKISILTCHPAPKGTQAAAQPAGARRSRHSTTAASHPAR